MTPENKIHHNYCLFLKHRRAMAPARTRPAPARKHPGRTPPPPLNSGAESRAEQAGRDMYDRKPRGRTAR